MNSAVLTFGKVTDIGKLRSRNEDAMGVRMSDTDGGASLFVVADGMGGHSAGNVASQIAVEQVISNFFSFPEPDVTERLRRAVEEANRKIFDTAQTNPEYFRMGTTVVSAAVTGNLAHVANVGDSRAYLVRDGKIEQVTRDHSWVALQVEMGELTPEEAATSQNRSVLLRCLGEKSDVLVDMQRVRLLKGDILILCSDGLHGQVNPEELKEHVLSKAPQKAAEELMQLANARGGPDNITVQVIKVDGCPEPTEEDASQPTVTFVDAPVREAVPAAAATVEAAGSAPAFSALTKASPGAKGAAGAASGAVTYPPPPPPPPPMETVPPVSFGPIVVAFLFGMLVALLGVRFWPTQSSPPPASLSSPGMSSSPVAPSVTAPSPSASPTGTVGAAVVKSDVVALPAESRPADAMISTSTGLYLVYGEKVMRAELQGDAQPAVPVEVKLPEGKVQAVAALGDLLYVAREKEIDAFAGEETGKPRDVVQLAGQQPPLKLTASPTGLYWLETGNRIHILRNGKTEEGTAVKAPHDVTCLAVGAGGELFWGNKELGIFDAKCQKRVQARPVGLWVEGRHLYWQEAPAGDEAARIFRCDLKGNGREMWIVTDAPQSCAVGEGHLYWMVQEGGHFVVKRAPIQACFKSSGGN